ncbi:hypothetical protein Bca4012_024930 [Brassica carinata]
MRIIDNEEQVMCSSTTSLEKASIISNRSSGDPIFDVYDDINHVYDDGVDEDLVIQEQGNNSKVQNSFQEPSRSDVVPGVKSMSVDSAGPSSIRNKICRYTAKQIEERMTKRLCMFTASTALLNQRL